MIELNLMSLVFSGLLAAGGMGLWHGVEYYEKERVVGEEFYQQWNSVSTYPIILEKYFDDIVLEYQKTYERHQQS